MLYHFQGTSLLMASGLLAITVAILMKVFHPYDLVFRWKLVFEEDGEIFNLWEKPPVDLFVKIYLLNITNADEFMAGREKLKLEEVGPYVYKEIMQHDDVVFNDNNTISSRPRHPLVFDQELSGNLREDDMFMMVNIALLSIAQVAADRSYELSLEIASFFFFLFPSIAQVAADLSFLVRFPVNVFIRKTESQPIVKMTAREFMFGYKTPLTTLGNTLFPDWIVFNKTGLIDRMYDFGSDYETFYTGADDPSISGLYATYRGSKDLSQWKGDEHCSNIEFASDGTKFKSFMKSDEEPVFFRKSMCRAQKLVRTGEEEIVSGLRAYRFKFEENSLDNGYYNEKNKCFCRNGHCQPRGLSDVTECYYGFPISLSYPHFLDSDPEVLESVEGLKPNRSLHETYFVINPKSGLPLSCSVKFQINMHMRDVRSMAHVERFSNMTLPMLWFDISMRELPKPLESRFNLYLNILPYIEPVGFWGGLVLGLLLMIFAMVQAVFKLPRFFAPPKKHFSQHRPRQSIYQPCEMSLIEDGEKYVTKLTNRDENMIICDVNSVEAHNYPLEDELAMSEDGNESCNGHHYVSLSEESENNRSSEDKSYQNESYNNNSYEPSQLDTIDEKNDWLMGAASSSIEDIGNNHFSSLIKSEDFDSGSDEENANGISIV